MPAPITPLPVPIATGRVLLFGGVFDPPHRAHTALAAAARDLGMGPETWLVFVPAARSPLKEDQPGAGDQHRVRMLELACRSIGRSAVWTDELDRARGEGVPSYWIETLRRARQAAPKESEIRFLIGADQAAQFHRWRSFREILEIARPLVLPRPPIEDADSLVRALEAQKAWSSAELSAWRSWVVPIKAVDPSSTGARALLLAGRDDEAAQLLDPEVVAYIERHRLYRR